MASATSTAPTPHVAARRSMGASWLTAPPREWPWRPLPSHTGARRALDRRGGPASGGGGGGAGELVVEPALLAEELVAPAGDQLVGGVVVGVEVGAVVVAQPLP